ncbi:MAG: hypothetical protein ACFFD4_28650 [Candidatus Odinarchaeota archaeon]
MSFDQKKYEWLTQSWVCPWCSTEVEEGFLAPVKDFRKKIQKKKKNYIKQVESISYKGKTEALCSKYGLNKEEFMDETDWHLKYNYNLDQVPVCRECGLIIGFTERDISRAVAREGKVIPGQPIPGISASPSLLIWLEQNSDLVYFLSGPVNKPRAWHDEHLISTVTKMDPEGNEWTNVTVSIHFWWFKNLGFLPGEYLVDAGQGYLLTNYRLVNIYLKGPDKGLSFLKGLERMGGTISFWVQFIIPFMDVELELTEDRDIMNSTWNVRYQEEPLQIKAIMTPPPPPGSHVDRAGVGKVFGRRDWLKLDAENLNRLKESGNRAQVEIIGETSDEKPRAITTFNLSIELPGIFRELWSTDRRVSKTADRRLIYKAQYPVIDVNPNLKSKKIKEKHGAMACGYCARPVEYGMVFEGTMVNKFISDKEKSVRKTKTGTGLPREVIFLALNYGLLEQAYLNLQREWVDDLFDVPICPACKDVLGITDEQWDSLGRPFGKTGRYQTHFMTHFYKSSTNVLHELLAAPLNYSPFAKSFFREQLVKGAINSVWGTRIAKQDIGSDITVAGAIWEDYYKRLQNPLKRWAVRNLKIVKGESLKGIGNNGTLITNYRAVVIEGADSSFPANKPRYVYTFPFVEYGLLESRSDIQLLTSDGNTITVNANWGENELVRAIFNEKAWTKLESKDQQKLLDSSRKAMVHGWTKTIAPGKIHYLNYKCVPVTLKKVNSVDKRDKNFWEGIADGVYLREQFEY